MSDNTQSGNGVKNGRLKPFYIIWMDYSGNVNGQQSNYLYITNLATLLSTNNSMQVFSNYGANFFVASDGGYLQTNRDAAGSLMLLPSLFGGSATASNWMQFCHTLGLGFLASEYYYIGPPLAGDSAMRGDLSGANVNSYPSQQYLATNAASGYTFPFITPDVLRKDCKWLIVSNFFDGLIIQDFTVNEGIQSYYHQRNVVFDDALLYIDGAGVAGLSQNRIFWKNYTNTGSGDGPISAGSYINTQVGSGTYIAHQPIAFFFQDHPDWEAQYHANVFSPNQFPQQLPPINSGMDRAASYMQGQIPYMTNWDPGNFPLMVMNASGFSSLDYSNGFAIGMTFNGIIGSQITTNAWGNSVAAFGGIDTNQFPLLTNANSMAVWTDVQHFPRIVLNDYTNVVAIRKYQQNGAFVLLAINHGTLTTNFNVSVCATDGSVNGIGLNTNQIYAVTNVYPNGAGAFTGGLMTNNFITNLLGTNVAWMIATPYRTQITNGAFAFWTTPVYAQ
jgi:hypothetical protein